jgi:hypothetical protein
MNGRSNTYSNKTHTYVIYEFMYHMQFSSLRQLVEIVLLEEGSIGETCGEMIYYKRDQ